MLKAIGTLIVLAIVVILLLALTKPSTFRVERSVTIAASPQKIAALINDFHQWDQWSPWGKLDPGMRTTYTGPSTGVGSIYNWEGNSKVGEGRMEILSVEPAKTSIKLDFLKPFESHSTTDFLLASQGSTTQIQWVMYGPINFFPSKIMTVFVPMDKLIGPDFERGLANLKTAAEHP